MADSKSMSERCEDLDTTLTRELSEILSESKLIKGPTTRFILNTTNLFEGESLKKQRIGEKNDEKPTKVILMVGETGTGKTTLVNAMINYIMGVKWEDRIWLEISEISGYQTDFQTAAVTVYEVYVQNCPFSLTVIDTPGFGFNDFDRDTQISEGLQQLFRSEDGVHKIHAVCLVLKATEARLHSRQQHILNKILSLFAKDIEKHIVVLLTNSLSQKSVPKKSLNFIKAAKIPCAKTKNDLPVYFNFDNCQSESFDEEDRNTYKSSWDNGIDSFKEFFDYLNRINPKSVNMTVGVLRAQRQLDVNVNNLNYTIKLVELRKQELKQNIKALDDLKVFKKDKNKFEYEVDQFSLKKVHIESQWWHLNKQATCCTVCEENCHYPGCWWVSNLSWCSVMAQGKCTVCTGKCHYTQHVKEDKRYEVVHWKVKCIEEDMKNKYKKDCREKKSLKIDLENEIQQLEADQIRLVEESYQCLEKLMDMALKPYSMSSIRHLDFIIEKVKETGKQDEIQKLEELKQKAEVDMLKTSSDYE